MGDIIYLKKCLASNQIAGGIINNYKIEAHNWWYTVIDYPKKNIKSDSWWYNGLS